MENSAGNHGGERPTILVTNDDGIDAPGLRSLVKVLVSTDRFNVIVCAPDSVRGKSNTSDFALAAEACLPILGYITDEIKKKTYPLSCFLNIDVPSDVTNHKGYRITKQGKSRVKMAWRRVTSESLDGHMLSTMTMDSSPDSTSTKEDASCVQESLLFRREVIGAQVEDGDTDYCGLQEGYITVTPLGALSPADMDALAFFEQWQAGLVEHFSNSSL